MRLSVYFRLPLIVLFLLSSIFALLSAPKRDLDSLLSVLDEPLNNQERFNTLVILSRQNFNNQLSLEDRIGYLEKALAMEHNADSVELIIFNLNELGRLYWLAGKPDESIDITYQVIEKAKDAQLAKWISNGYGNLAASQKSLGDYRAAFEAEKVSLEIILQTTDSLLIYNGLTNHAETQYVLGMYDSLDQTIRQADSFFADKDDPGFIYVSAGLAQTKSYRSALNNRFTESDSLFEYSRDILTSYQNRELDRTIALAGIELAKIYFTKEEWTRASELASYGYNIGIRHGLNEVIRNGAEILYQIYEKSMDHQKANQYLKDYFKYRDTLLNLENIKKVEALRADFEINQKQIQVDLLETQKLAREQFLWGLSIIALLLILGAVIIYRSYRIQLELSHQLADQKKQLEDLNHSKDKLFSILSHDLRGPIAAFGGVSQMIRLAIKNNSLTLLEEIADEIKKTAGKLSETLENLLSWAMKERGMMEIKTEKIDVNLLFEDLFAMYNNQAKSKNIQLQIDAEKDLQLFADKNSTYTIFRNLISNAIKFTPQNGTITLSAADRQDDIMLSVTDTGLGLKQQQIDNLFKFTRDKSTFGTEGEKGLGLGLSLVYDMVSANRGRIEVSSKISQGTSFHVSLPKS